MRIINVDKEQAIFILRAIDEEDWESTVPDTSNLTVEELKKKHPTLMVADDIRIGGHLYREAVRFCEKDEKQFKKPIQLHPIKVELEEGLNTQWRRCHQNVNACIEKFGGYKIMGYVIRRHRRSLLDFDLHSVWVDTRGVFGEPGKILDVTPENPRESFNGGFRLFAPFNIDEGAIGNAPNSLVYPTSQGGERLARHLREERDIYIVENEDTFLYQACPKMCDKTIKEDGFNVIFVAKEDLMNQLGAN